MQPKRNWWKCGPGGSRFGGKVSSFALNHLEETAGETRGKVRVSPWSLPKDNWGKAVCQSFRGKVSSFSLPSHLEETARETGGSRTPVELNLQALCPLQWLSVSASQSNSPLEDATKETGGKRSRRFNIWRERSPPSLRRESFRGNCPKNWEKAGGKRQEHHLRKSKGP